MLRKWFTRMLCALGHCTRCRAHSTDEGIGGKCEACGRIHGWVTREELGAYYDAYHRMETAHIEAGRRDPLPTARTRR